MSREVHVPFYERLGVQFPRPTHRFALSFRDVEDVLARRGVDVTYEAIRKWCRRFGPEYAGRLRRRRGRLGDTWHLDEVFVTIQGRQQYLWRAVDEDGDVLDILVQPRRNRHAAVRFFRKISYRPLRGRYEESPSKGPSISQVPVSPVSSRLLPASGCNRG